MNDKQKKVYVIKVSLDKTIAIQDSFAIDSFLHFPDSYGIHAHVNTKSLPIENLHKQYFFPHFVYNTGHSVSKVIGNLQKQYNGATIHTERCPNGDAEVQFSLRACFDVDETVPKLIKELLLKNAIRDDVANIKTRIESQIKCAGWFRNLWQKAEKSITGSVYNVPWWKLLINRWRWKNGNPGLSKNKNRVT